MLDMQGGFDVVHLGIRPRGGQGTRGRGATKPVKESIDRAEADKLKAGLEEAGATFELK